MFLFLYIEKAFLVAFGKMQSFISCRPGSVVMDTCLVST